MHLSWERIEKLQKIKTLILYSGVRSPDHVMN